MVIRIIQINQPEEFWEKFEKDRYCKQSQRRSGVIARLNEDDIVYIFKTGEDVINGEIRYKCRVTQLDEKISDGEDTFAKIEIEEVYDKGTCTYDDLKNKGYIKSRNFHWNKLPDFDKYLEEKCKTGKMPECKSKKIVENKNEKKKETKKKDKKKKSKKEKIQFSL